MALDQLFRGVGKKRCFVQMASPIPWLNEGLSAQSGTQEHCACCRLSSWVPPRRIPPRPIHSPCSQVFPCSSITLSNLGTQLLLQMLSV